MNEYIVTVKFPLDPKLSKVISSAQKYNYKLPDIFRNLRKLIKLFSLFKVNPNGDDIQQQRKQLPIFHVRQSLLKKISKNLNLIVLGETACGKTTQIPQVCSFIFNAITSKLLITFKVNKSKYLYVFQEYFVEIL